MMKYLAKIKCDLIFDIISIYGFTTSFHFSINEKDIEQDYVLEGGNPHFLSIFSWISLICQ